MPNICSEQLINLLMKPHAVNYPGICGTALPEVSAAKVASLDGKNMQATSNHTPQQNQSGVTSIENENYSQICLDQSAGMNSSSSKINVAGKSHSSSKVENQASVGISEGKLKLEAEHLQDQLSQLTSTGECIVQKLSSGHTTQQNATNHLAFQNQNQGHSQLQSSLWPTQALPESSQLNPQPIHAPLADAAALNCSLPFLEADEWITNPMSIAGMYRSGPLSMFGLQDPSAVFPEAINPSLPYMNQDVWDHQMSNLRILSQANQFIPLAQQEPCNFNSGAVKDLSDESNDQSGIYGSLNVDAGNGGGSVVDPSVSSAILDEFCTLKDADLQNASDCLVGNLSSNQDVQSQITSASLADSQAFSRQDFPDNSGGTSSSNVDFDNSNLLQNSSWQQVAQRVRTYTKVQKTGSVGRSIDVSSFKNYEELCSAIECMFGLDGLLNNPKGSGWKLVYVDYENDVLLIGDDPWEEFVGCVRCIRILSPSEVQQMSEEGMKLLNSANIQGTNAPITEGSHA
ncbi:unnamed protein product [Dovyalis caffra]|uniref:Auxin-responsive protein n=1 Tax=Dovyalis caffra TaxID=77055 RepID=A0AAV1S480_9ROSI|nr:unnamed protein product [Dovyalis caffra]